MDMQAVSSSNIESIGYDNSTRVLAVKFKASKTRAAKVHLYHQFTLDGYRNFLNAPSKGKYFAEFVRGKYQSMEAST